jgi:sec-independent protein translocase protein TatB
MLDFGFSEILLTSAIALVVLGPEKLPKVARQVGNWMGRARLMARQLSEQLEREVNAEELLKQQTRISAPARAPVATTAAPPAAAAPSEAVSPPALESLPAVTAVADETATAAAIAPEPVIAPPVRRRTPHPNSPEMMHAKERLAADSPADVQATPAPPTPQQSTQ